MSTTETDDLLAQSHRAPSGRGFLKAFERFISARIEAGCLDLVLPSGRTIRLRGQKPGPFVTLKINRWRMLSRVLRDGDIGFAEAYMAGDCDTPDLNAFFQFSLVNTKFGNIRPLAVLNPLRRMWHGFNRNSLRGSRRNIVAHYDLGNDFYAPWLDKSMTYSSALYASDNDSLEQAQQAKLNAICEMLEMERGQDVLEIGCGWGALAERLAAQNFGSYTGITLSDEQLKYCETRAAAFSKAEFKLLDYRNVKGAFDRIVSIEMIEAVGAAYWPSYFKTLRSTLRDGGVVVLQAITIAEERFADYRSTPDFIQKYIFPGGMLLTKKIIESQAADAGLKLVKAKTFGLSYAKTLEEWKKRFQDAWPVISKPGFDDKFKRMWEYYLDYCRAGFETRAIDVGLYKIVPA